MNRVMTVVVVSVRRAWYERRVMLRCTVLASGDAGRLAIDGEMPFCEGTYAATIWHELAREYMRATGIDVAGCRRDRDLGSENSGRWNLC